MNALENKMQYLKIGMISLGVLAASALAGFANNYSDDYYIPRVEQPVASVMNIAFEIDPTVTGNSVSADQLQNWIARKKRYDECGLCGEMQAFPSE